MATSPVSSGITSLLKSWKSATGDVKVISLKRIWAKGEIVDNDYKGFVWGGGCLHQ